MDGRPFAALRSMYVTDFNNDVARIAVREKGAKGWREEPIMAFKRATATDVWAGRVSPSRHNTSSPDMVFSAFVEADPAPSKPGGKKCASSRSAAPFGRTHPTTDSAYGRRECADRPHA